MNKLFLGKVLETRGGAGSGIVCDLCKEKDKKCAVIEVPYLVKEYETELRGGLFSSYQDVVVDYNFITKTEKVDICGDCAEQIYKQLKS